MAFAATVSTQGMQMENLDHHLLDSSGKYVTVQAGELSPQAQKIWQLSHPDVPVPTPKVTMLKAPQRAEEEFYTVTPVLADYPEMNLSPGMYSFAFLNGEPENLYQAMYFGPAFSIPFNLPAGVYDFVLYFWSAESDGIRCILKEDVEVNGDMEITADPAEATEHIVFRPVLADGERIRTELWIETASGEWEIADAGNCAQADYFTQFVYKDVDFMLYTMNIVDRTDEEGNVVSGSRPGDVWISPSSKLKVYQKTVVCQQEEGVSLIVVGADIIKNQELSNDPVNYTEPLTANFADCLIMPEIEQGPYSPNPYIAGCAGFSTFINGNYSGSNGLESIGKTWDSTTYRLCMDPNYRPEVMVIPQIYKIFTADNEKGISYSIVAPLYSPENNQWVAGHQPSIFTHNNYFLAITNNQNEGKVDEPYNYFYSVPVTDDIVFGDNVPVTVFLKPTNQFSYSFVGRYGEIRTIDFYSSTLSVKCNGEELCSDYFDLSNFFWSEEGQQEGEWSMVINNENIEVDGLRGRNHCEMNFVNGSVGLTPTVMQMQLRTIDDKVTDKFTMSEEGLLTFYAGGFKFDYNPITFGQWFSYEPLDEVKVEYSPYGSEDYSLLNVSEDPEKFFMPGYGAYYYAELDQLTVGSKTGWYDVRISLKDSEGNTQVQTVSPAFFIDSLSGVETVSESRGEVKVKVEGHDIIAPEGSVIFNAAGIQTGSRNLAPGVYIVCTPSCSTKCVIK